MPLVPHTPTDERRERRAPDIDEIVEDILGSGEEDPKPVVG